MPHLRQWNIATTWVAQSALSTIHAYPLHTPVRMPDLMRRVAAQPTHDSKIHLTQGTSSQLMHAAQPHQYHV